MQKLKISIIIALGVFAFGNAQEIAILKYNGGGDWYSNPTALPNLINFCNTNINTRINPKPETVEPGSTDIFQFPFVHMTGHGNVIFSDDEIENLRNYLLSGGFLHIDDNYGMNEYIRKEIKKLFPEKDLTELPANHPVFSAAFDFPNGLPKIHEHDALPPQAFGIIENDRLVLLFTFESDLGDGWESPEVHNDPEEVRQKALKMGANIIKYAFEN
ncbi:DUF4159 domain-containing protein [Christiangramia sediminis]|uniref:DUF4159 domain-containing protein n=1 Tax=Christiangramia sediminis TaxID=2881336 RepID=A0A9X1LH01_9FLAO|nr:DUF4159 domain-containing protein [Christiangramia sediminis]MCB7480221.1 DUF4159 domain-containing protein [Christiangramia sediminis]